ncbi:cation transporter [Neptunomonas sp.]|uniref:cation transporter n=1 Tax=Neptunomonas sp. TaxID=1971898 RepID=UPI003562E2AF
MKKLMALIMLPMIFGTSSLVAEIRTVSLKVDNMTCAACPYIVKKSLLSLEGVSQASVDYDQKTATVTFDDDKSSVAKLTASKAKAGYPSALME